MFNLELMFFVDVVLYAVALLVLFYTFSKMFVRSNIWKLLVISFFIKVMGEFLFLSMFSTLADVLLVALFIMVVVANQEKIISLLRRKRNVIKFNDSTDNEKKQLYKAIDSAVGMLSTNKIGAIITFEQNNSLDEYIKTGVKIDAPVKAELLTTIFYPGTTLHDGAVIIRGNTIEAASVYYTPTTKAMKGKYGARHRASLGISEVCDAITVVVSEETGRISIAMDGELQAVTRENFVSIFEDVMERTV